MWQRMEVNRRYKIAAPRQGGGEPGQDESKLISSRDGSSEKDTEFVKKADLSARP